MIEWKEITVGQTLQKEELVCDIILSEKVIGFWKMFYCWWELWFYEQRKENFS